jgi:deaminated glutathione amidase
MIEMNSNLDVDNQSLTVAAIQMVTSADFELNLASAEQLILQAKQGGADLVVLPEYFAIMAKHEKDKFKVVESHQNGRLQNFLAQQSRSHQIWLVGGSHPINSDDPKRPMSRCYVYNPQGNVVCFYDKIHLFDVHVDDATQQYQESKYSQAGNQAVAFDTPWGKVGIAICYDLRFPELFRQLNQMQAKLFVIPAAFTFATGEQHWDILLKARAVENLSYVVASAQGGLHQNGRETYGHSCVISPWGKTLVELNQGEGVAIAKIDFSEQEKIRKNFPALQHRKL